MHNRPIVNTRDEPHADPAKYRRLHGIAGDANMSEYATALKIGTTTLVIALIEQGKIPDSLTLANPDLSYLILSKPYLTIRPIVG